MIKRLTLFAVIVCTIPVVGSREGARQRAGGDPTTGIFNALSYLPQIDSNFSDLDARDAQNRPIKDPSATGELLTLFHENLLNLTLYLPAHAVTDAYALAEAFSRLFNKLFFDRAEAAFVALEEAALLPSRRFVHNVHNLWIVFSVGLFFKVALLSASYSIRSNLKLNLRC